ncbi:hypothetical protein HBH98_241750 [Parastagonospora nodorum]|nr:hypothetical protein HBH53_246590 [Parastagonospora nodorum]KAH3956579.1 hypothetical protein HBH51_238880 [Parastagonospora nodorum]KAH4215578.1 hypothetical protein HBI06_245970 [Parastagonospora nodorum]KAH4224341.1 hypothetical protein HBI05_239020 [Parastagonospora nodorum]KAH4334400.1 hypothetical protein HBH98_241750 [Parastagonospora nodorum]
MHGSLALPSVPSLSHSAAGFTNRAGSATYIQQRSGNAVVAPTDQSGVRQNGCNSDAQGFYIDGAAGETNVDMQDALMYEVTEASTTSSPAAAHPSSHASFYSGPIAHRQPYVSVRPSFSVPSLPVSAALSTIRQPIAAAARRVQAGTTYTRASTYTPPASSPAKGGRVTLARDHLEAKLAAECDQRKLDNEGIGT